MTPAEILTQCGDDDAPRGCCFQNLDGHMVCRTCAERAIAAAVKAERRACAEIAERAIPTGDADPFSDISPSYYDRLGGQRDATESIRDAIRARGTR